MDEHIYQWMNIYINGLTNIKWINKYKRINIFKMEILYLIKKCIHYLTCLKIDTSFIAEILAPLAYWFILL